MKIFGMTVDKRPTECFLCPIEKCGIRMTKDKCGKIVHRKLSGGWETDVKFRMNVALYMRLAVIRWQDSIGVTKK